MKRLALGMAALLALAACGRSGWPVDAVESFLSQCPYPDTVCECMIEDLQGAMSFEEFETAVERGGPPPQEFAAAEQKCLSG